MKTRKLTEHHRVAPLSTHRVLQATCTTVRSVHSHSDQKANSSEKVQFHPRWPLRKHAHKKHPLQRLRIWKERQLQRRLEQKHLQRVRRLVNVLTAIGMIAMIILAYVAYAKGYFSDLKKLQHFLQGFGIWAPLVFIMIQIVQCILPFIPGGVSLLLGVVAFGPWLGFLYNYVGIVLGEAGGFLLARRYGKWIVRALTSDKAYEKSIGWLEKKERGFKIFFITTMLLPGMPDDLICMVAGLSSMRFRVFFFHLLWTKAPTIILYTLFLEQMVGWSGRLRDMVLRWFNGS